jgi:hypothetical protein
MDDYEDRIKVRVLKTKAREDMYGRNSESRYLVLDRIWETEIDFHSINKS